MVKKIFGLGKGLGSLIPDNTSVVKPDTERENIFNVEIHKIRTNPDQPRKGFDKDSLGELSKSIRKYGVLQPLLVSKVEEESSRGMNVYYQLIAGERRLRAAKLAGIPNVPVIIRDDLPQDKSSNLELALVENIQRDDLNPLEEAEAYGRFSKDFGLTQNEISAKVSKSREAVANAVRLLKLPNYAKDALRAGKITAAHARALLALGDQTKQKDTYDQIIKGKLSSKDVETTAARAKGCNSSQRHKRFAELEKNLGEKLNTGVLIKGGAKKNGQIVIKFATQEELNIIAKNIID